MNPEEYRLQIRQALGSSRLIPYGQVRGFVRGLREVADELQKLIDEGYPQEAADLIESFLKLCKKRMVHTDDSGGETKPFMRKLYQLWNSAWCKIQDRDKKALTKKVIRFLEDNGMGYEDDLIEDIYPAIGDEGLTLLEKEYVRNYENRLNELSGHDPSRHDSALSHCEIYLLQIADVRRDVDTYIRLSIRHGLKDYQIPGIVSRLIAHKRYEEAFDYANRLDVSRPQTPFGDNLFKQVAELKTAVLDKLGRSDDAQKLAWQEFLRDPQSVALRRVIQLTPKEKQCELQSEAFQYVEEHGKLWNQLEVFTEEKQWDRLVKAVFRNTGKMGEVNYSTWLAVAEALEGKSPEVLIEIYKHLAWEILEQKRGKAFHHAVSYLKQVKLLCKETGQLERWTSLVEEIRKVHGKKSSFMQPFERMCGR